MYGTAIYWLEGVPHVPRPALAEGDGPIGRYRQWARQFHGGTAEAPEAP